MYIEDRVEYFPIFLEAAVTSHCVSICGCSVNVGSS